MSCPGPAGSSIPCQISMPCGGLGMSNQAAINTAGQQFAAMRPGWDAMSPFDRRQGINQIVQGAAASSGFPAPRLRPDAGLQSGNGYFDFPTWDLASPTQDFVRPTTTDDEYAVMVDTVMHETRHAEQWFLIMRRDAANGMNADEIMAARDVTRRDVAEAAVANPLHAGDPMRACADQLYNSVYGTGANARNAVFDALDADNAAYDSALSGYDTATAAYDAAVGDPLSTPAEIANALSGRDTAYTAATQAHAQTVVSYGNYVALPEEADAFDVGSRAETAFRAALGP